MSIEELEDTIIKAMKFANGIKIFKYRITEIFESWEQFEEFLQRNNFKYHKYITYDIDTIEVIWI